MTNLKFIVHFHSGQYFSEEQIVLKIINALVGENTTIAVSGVPIEDEPASLKAENEALKKQIEEMEIIRRDERQSYR